MARVNGNGGKSAPKLGEKVFGEIFTIFRYLVNKNGGTEMLPTTMGPVGKATTAGDLEDLD